MNKFPLLLLATLALPAAAEEIQGVVESVDTTTNVAKIRTATSDIFVNIYNTSAEVQNALRAPEARTSIRKFEIPTEAIGNRTPVSTRANCSELPVSVNDLESIANNSSNMVEFLQKLPKGSLPSFTFVTNSLSLQRGEDKGNGRGIVNRMWPRVLRGSTDGKLSMSFVCDPENPTYGTVEIIHFDDKTNSFKTMEIDFGGPNRTVTPDHRVTHNPQSCVTCHAGSTINGQVSLKPNWPEYFFWSDCQDNRGIQFYGSSDDNMAPGQFRDRIGVSSSRANRECSSDQDQALVAREQEAYPQFREMQKDNPCFNTLPWENAAGVSENHRQYYPYSANAQDMDKNGGMQQDYARRTNTRFTDVYSHLMAKRNFELIKNSREYEKVKYFLAMEEAGCIEDQDRARLRQIMPEIQPTVENPQNPASFSQYSIEQSAPILWNYSQRIGLQPQDWSMEFRDNQSPNYNAVMFYNMFDGDATIFDVTAGNVLADIGTTNPQIRDVANSNLSRGITEVFGEEFSCIDDLGGAVAPSRQGRQDLCTPLREQNERHLASLDLKNITCEECNNRTPAEATPEKTLEQNVAEVLAQASAEQINRGKELMETKGNCMNCHSMEMEILPTEFNFIPGSDEDAESLAILRSQPANFPQTLQQRLVDDADMPPGRNDLTKEDREALRAYILSLIPQR